MAVKNVTQVFFAVAAAAIVSAPAAGAVSSADCDNDGPASVCTRNGHNAIYAEPRQTDPGVGVMMVPGLGGPMPPLLAMD
jgi:Na+/proline symporter